MRNKLIFGFLLAIGVFVIRSLSPSTVHKVTVPVLTQDTKPALATNSSLQTPKRNPAASAPAPQGQASISSNTNSLDQLSHTLSQVSQQRFTLTNLLEELQRSGQQPVVVRDENPDTGEMLIVRTKNPLAGTRYFHAQYFSDDTGQRFVQHMSFEFKPGPEAMAQAIATVERNFPNLSRPVVKRNDYVKWTLADDYIVWVKKMATSDLKDDPFNSYSASDDGTIRVAVELDIHAQ